MKCMWMNTVDSEILVLWALNVPIHTTCQVSVLKHFFNVQFLE